MMQTKELAKYLMEQFEGLGEVTSRAMMGGYIFYYKKKIFGGIYEPGFMVKISAASKKYLQKAEIMPPYDGAKAMFLVAEIDDRELLCAMVNEMYDELPVPKPKAKRD